MATRNLVVMNALAHRLVTWFGQMRLRTRVAICTRVMLAVALLIAGLVKIIYPA